MPALLRWVWARGIGALVVVVLTGASDVHAQHAKAGLPTALRSAQGGSGAGHVLAAAVLPGAAQFEGGRYLSGALLLAVEIGGWWVHLDARDTRDRSRDAYRQLAWEVARGEIEPRIDPSFEYYEDLINWSRSGAFDSDALVAGLQPERDPDTFNGRQWELAAAIFLEGEVGAAPTAIGYGSALEYYRDRAWGDDFGWDWAGDASAQLRFGELIDEADGAARRASVTAGVVIANHLLSAVEAFVSHRLGMEQIDMRMAPHRGHPGRSQLHISIPWSH